MPLRTNLLLIVIVALLPLAASGCGGSAKMAMDPSSAPDSASRAGAAAPDADDKAGSVTTWKRSRLVPNTSKLMVGDTESLPIKGMHAKIHVDGFRARVVLDYYFANPHGSTLEGTFKVRLPDSASPYFFAFGETLVMAADAAPPQPDSEEQARAMGSAPTQIMADRQQSWRGPKEARMVPRAKAAIAYGSTVRRQVDPALMEWSGAGMFSARVFPITAGRQHRIVIAYDMQLVAAGADHELRFDIPEDIPSLTVDFDVAKLPNAKLDLTPAATGADDGARLFYRFAQPQQRSIKLRVVAPPTLVLTGESPGVGPLFTTTFVPKLPAAAVGSATDRAIFLVDTSLSANPDGFNVWLKLLRALLDNNRDSIKEFALLYFNVEASWWRTQLTANQPAEVDALLADAQTLVLEGATDLGAALRAGAQPPWLKDGKRHDVFLLSDGAATWGESDLFAMSKAFGSGQALFAYRTGMAGSDTAGLEVLTRETGGALFSVVGEAEIKQASSAHRKRPWSLEGVHIAGGDDLLLAGRPRVLFPGQRVTLVGRGQPASGAAVELKVKQAGGQAQVVKTTLAQALSSELAARSYGQVAVGQLEELGSASERIATPYAMHFRVTGKSCSLLMLDSEADYQRHNIRPKQNALVVRKRPAAAAVSTLVSQLGGSLGDPKARTLRWLDKMKRTPGVQLDIDESLWLTLEDLPASSFAVPAWPLTVMARTKPQVPAAIVSRLAKRDLDYDAFTSEALRRGKQHGAPDALKALSSLVEHSPGDAVLARDVGLSAMQWGLNAQAYHLFRRVAAKRPFEPQTYRAMARALERMGRADLAMAYYEVGLAGRWDERFGEFKTIIAVDYLRMLRRIERGKLKTNAPEYAKARLATLAKQSDATGSDLVVMITWNTDNTDVDLHVIEPSGEECYYSHPSTDSGGRLSRDVTQGYGPEMYVLKRAPAGNYHVRVKYFASDSNRLSARSKVQITTFQRFGTPHEKTIDKTVTLERGKEMHDIATIQVGKQVIAR